MGNPNTPNKRLLELEPFSTMKMLTETGSKPARSANPKARPNRSGPAEEEPFLVIVLDQADDTGHGLVVRAEHYEAAETKALERFKADNELSHLSDADAGFKAIATYSRDCLHSFVREMELPEPEI
jgi:hypothetical protein